MPHIHFTLEAKQNSSTSFLDVLLARQVLEDNNTTYTTLFSGNYKKPTYNNRYLHNISHHPKYQKLHVAKILIHNKILVSNKNHLQSKLHNMSSTLRLKDFQLKLLISFLTKFKPMQQCFLTQLVHVLFEIYQQNLTNFERGKSQSSHATCLHSWSSFIFPQGPTH